MNDTNTIDPAIKGLWKGLNDLLSSCYKAVTFSGLEPGQHGSHQLASRHHLHLAADVDGRLVAFPFRPQVQ